LSDEVEVDFGAEGWRVEQDQPDVDAQVRLGLLVMLRVVLRGMLSMCAGAVSCSDCWGWIGCSPCPRYWRGCPLSGLCSAARSVPLRHRPARRLGEAACLDSSCWQRRVFVVRHVNMRRIGVVGSVSWRHQLPSDQVTVSLTIELQSDMNYGLIWVNLYFTFTGRNIPLRLNEGTLIPPSTPLIRPLLMVTCVNEFLHKERIEGVSKRNFGKLVVIDGAHVENSCHKHKVLDTRSRSKPK
jgi:hypothetical protein